MIVKHEIPEIILLKGFYRIKYKTADYAITNFMMEFVSYDGDDCFQFNLKNKYGQIENVNLCLEETKEMWPFMKAIYSLGNFVFKGTQTDFETMMKYIMDHKL